MKGIISIIIRLGLILIVAFVTAGCCNRGSTTIYYESYAEAEIGCENYCKDACVTSYIHYVSSGVYTCYCNGVLD